jgi:hypothetical protein
MKSHERRIGGIKQNPVEIGPAKAADSAISTWFALAIGATDEMGREVGIRAGPVERPLRDLREHSGKLFGRCRAPDFWPPLRVWLGQLLASFGAPGHKRASCLEVF